MLITYVHFSYPLNKSSIHMSFGVRNHAYRCYLNMLIIKSSRNHVIGSINYFYSFKFCAYNIIRRCVSEIGMNILSYFHDGVAGGHYRGRKTAAKVLEVGFFWPALFKDARNYVIACDKFQRSDNISKRSENLLTLFRYEKVDVWGINFMGPFPPPNDPEYILVVVDYVSSG